MSTRFSTIIVPLDGTRSSERALAFAKALAAPAGGELILLRVDGSDVPARRSRGRRTGVFARVAAAWTELGANRRLQEDMARSIASVAARRGADLLAMSTHARSAPGQWLLGSVADQVVRAADVPVLLVPPGAQVGQGERLAHAVVALDGSVHAEAALGPARVLARQCGTRLTLVRVVGPWAEVVRDDRKALAYLEQLARELQAEGISVAIQTRYGETAAELASSADEHGADVIVMATRARGGIARLALGSVYAATLRQARVPLLVVRSKRLGRTRQSTPLESQSGRLVSAAA